jgi:DNA adenine methylase
MKYLGSKARIALPLVRIMLKDRKDGQWYVEPFAGGMNIIDCVEGLRIASDINTYLIEMWRELLSGWVPRLYTRKEYNQVRANPDKYPAHEVGWIGFNCSYCGKWFGGFAETYKTKGIFRDSQKEALRHIEKQLPYLKGIKLHNESYKNLDIPPNSIVYCDPPYKETTGYGTEFNHTDFWKWVREVSKDGHRVFVSEYQAPKDFKCIYSTDLKSNIHKQFNTDDIKVSKERLFIYDPSIK